MRISQLRAFAASARLGTFTAAAQSLGLAQPTVSELVKSLEEESGLELFVRGARRLVLTPAGEQLLPWARQASESVAGAESLARSLRGISGGVASFGVLRNAEFYLLSNLAHEFHRRYPGVRIRLVGQNSVSVAAAVRSGELEAGLVVLPVPDEGLSVVPLLRDEVIWVSADPERVARPMSLERLGDAPLILYDAQYGSTDPTRRQLADRAQAAGSRLEPLIEVENVDTALALVARGVGDTMVASAVARSSVFPRGLGTTPFAEPLHDVIALVTRERSPLSPVTRALADLATDLLLGVDADRSATDDA